MSPADPSPDHDLAALKMAWSSRIPELVAGEGLAGRQDLADDLARALDHAALSGGFDLHALSDFTGSGDLPALRQALAEASDPVPGDDGRRRWLRPERRKGVLRDLVARPDDLAALLARLPADADAAGRALRDLLRGHRPDPDGLGDDELAALLTVLGWLDGLTLPQGQAPLPDIHELRREAARREVEARRTSLTHGFVGRRTTLMAIERLVDDPSSDGSVLILSGPGGIGKSALLALVAQNLADRTPPVPVFTFDFDRPALDPRGVGLMMEFTRQLAAYLPAEAARLSAIRSEMWRNQQMRGGEGSGGTMAAEASLRTQDEFAGEIAAMIAENGLESRPLLLVLDTLEVLIGQGDVCLYALEEWTQFLRYGLGLSQLRILAAGRAAETAMARLSSVRSLSLAPLSAADARQLLINLGLDRRRAGAAARMLGGSPLTLRLGGRFLLENPGADISDLDPGSAGGAVLSRGLLYRRILNHLGRGPDDPLRKLALPALVLRVVTPALLARVVAPALGLDPLSPDEAAGLFDRLARNGWVVTPEAAGLVRHRRELRAEALRFILHDPDLNPVVDRLHHLARDHFQAGNDPDLADQTARLEAIYHELMLLRPGEELAKADAELVASVLKGDFADLAPHAAALARACAGIAPLPGDLYLVPRARREVVMTQLGWAALDADAPLDALDLAPGDTRPWAWRLTAWQIAAEWDRDEVGRALQLLDEFGEAWRWSSRGEAGSERPVPPDPRETPAQTAAVAAWLHLLRGADAPHLFPVPDASAGSMDQRTSLALLRQAVAGALTLLVAGEREGAGWDAVTSLGLGALPPATAPRGPALLDEMARFSLLLWAGGRMSTTTFLGLDRDAAGRSVRASPPGRPASRGGLAVRHDLLQARPAMITVTPSWLARYRQLVEHHAEACDKIDRITGQITPQTDSAQLTGSLAQEVVDAIELSGGFDVGNLRAAGFAPHNLVPGLMHEFRTSARALLHPLVADLGSRWKLGEKLPDILRTGDEGFLPADFQPEIWLAAAGRSRGSRAISALVDWAGRTGRLGKLLDEAAFLMPEGVAETLRIVRLAAAMRRIEQALAHGRDAISEAGDSPAIRGQSASDEQSG